LSVRATRGKSKRLSMCITGFLDQTAVWYFHIYWGSLGGKMSSIHQNSSAIYARYVEIKSKQE